MRKPPAPEKEEEEETEDKKKKEEEDEESEEDCEEEEEEEEEDSKVADTEKSGAKTNADNEKDISVLKEAVNEHIVTESEKQAEADKEEAQEK